MHEKIICLWILTKHCQGYQRHLVETYFKRNWSPVKNKYCECVKFVKLWRGEPECNWEKSQCGNKMFRAYETGLPNRRAATYFEIAFSFPYFNKGYLTLRSWEIFYLKWFPSVVWKLKNIFVTVWVFTVYLLRADKVTTF